jgi:hypothetical protein
MLERDLALLSRAVRYPSTPDLASRFAGRLAEQRGPFGAPAWRFGGAVAAALAVLAVAVVAIAPVRDAVADIFGRIDIFQADEVPPGISYEIEGRGVSLEEAETALGFELQLPPGPPPVRVLLQEFGQVRAAALFFEPEGAPAYVLFETNAIVGKGIPTGGAEAEPVGGLGGDAYWLTGLRIVQYEEPDGAVLYQSQRVTDENTLIWERDGFVFRIEGPLEKEAAVDVAGSLR